MKSINNYISERLIISKRLKKYQEVKTIDDLFKVYNLKLIDKPDRTDYWFFIINDNNLLRAIQKYIKYEEVSLEICHQLHNKFNIPLMNSHTADSSWFIILQPGGNLMEAYLKIPFDISEKNHCIIMIPKKLFKSNEEKYVYIFDKIFQEYLNRFK